MRAQPERSSGAPRQEALPFLVTLRRVFRKGLAQEMVVAPRRCLERVWVDAQGGQLKLAVRGWRQRRRRRYRS